MVSKRFDYEYIVIGGGTAGISAALQLANAGRKVAIVEQDRWGGSGLNYTDVPMGAALQFSHLYSRAIAGSKFGISSANLRFNYPSVQHWRDFAITRTGGNSTKELEAAGVTCIHGKAHFTGVSDLAIEGQEKPISANKFLIATGSSLNTNGISGLDKSTYYTPNTALKIDRPPKTVLVVGGGSTGCELAQYFAEIGAKVVIVEMSSRILPKEDEEIGQLTAQYMEKKLGIKTFASTRVIALEGDKKASKVVFLRNGKEHTVSVEAVVLATGSTPNTDLGLPNAHVSFDKNGIVVDKTFQTSSRNIFAVGDVTGGESSTDRAIYAAAIAVNNMLGRGRLFANYAGFIKTINIDPQIAVVGLSEDDLNKRSKKYKRVFVPLSVSRAAIISNEPIGFVKILSDSQGKILGAAIMAPRAAEMIQELSLAIRHGLTLEQLASTPHVSGSWSEVVAITTKKALM